MHFDMDGLKAPSKVEVPVKETPPVPIKTYRWEDIRRARRKGGYPWTHLDKEAFDEIVDPSLYRMDTHKHAADEEQSEVTIEDITDQETAATTQQSNDNVGIVDSPNGDAAAQDAIALCDDNKDSTSPSSTDIKDAPGPSTLKSILKKGEKRDERAKSEEPGRKRKHSIESSYSRISKYSMKSSRLGRCLKEMKDKIKLPKFFQSEPKLDDTSKAKTDKEKKPSTSKQYGKYKAEGPLIIHIPLKPPPGETDEFSYLEFEEPPKKVEAPVEKKPEPEPETPLTPDDKVQLIFLTAPSDDEILDEAPIPETPLESNSKPFDEMRMDELKSLAKDVVEKYSPKTKRKTYSKRDGMVIEDIDEEKAKEPTSNDDTVVAEEVVTPPPPVEETPPVEEKVVKIKKKKRVRKEKSTEEPKKEDDEKKIIESQQTDDDKIKERSKSEDEDKTIDSVKEVTVDEEDGLKTERVIAEIIDNDVKESDEAAKEDPYKKKVSFKRRSKDDNEGIYEVVQVSSEAGSPMKTPAVEDTSSDVHEEATIHNKWSKSLDHEYEPVNPPPDLDSVALTGDLNQSQSHQRSIYDEEMSTPQSPPVAERKPGTPVSDSDIEFLAARVADLQLRTKKIVGGEAPPKQPEESQGLKLQETIKQTASSLRRQASILGERASSQAEKLHTRVKSIKRPSFRRKSKEPSEPPPEGEPVEQEQQVEDEAVQEKPAQKHSIKMPHIQMPKMPQVQLPKMPKMPKMPQVRKPTMPKMPQMRKPRMPTMPASIKKMSMPAFTLPRKGKRSAQRRQFSTESTVGDSRKKIFDFKTYPRIFKKKRSDDGDDVHTPRTGTDVTPLSEQSTLPRFTFPSRWKGKFVEVKSQPSTQNTENSLVSKESERSDARDSVRIPLHSEDSMEQDEEMRRRTNEINLRNASNDQYVDDIDMDDAYMKENQEIHRASSLNAKLGDRWTHGTFHEANVDKENVPIATDENVSKKVERGGSSDNIHRRGVLEEINSDEFFLRQKGISQDNIEVGAYLSSEIREAFRSPDKMEIDADFEDLDLEVTMPEAPKRRPLKKKPKRKKTPHVSQEQISFELESVVTEPDDILKQYEQEPIEAPLRPQRKSKKAQRYLDELESQVVSHDDFMPHEISNENIMYENEQMQGIEQPGILVSDPYQEAFFRANLEHAPIAPPRKDYSLRSLNASEPDSITGELNGFPEHNVEDYRHEHEYQIPTPEMPPKRPTRTRSRTRSQSQTTSQFDDEIKLRHADSYASDQQSIPCVEEPCTRTICDYMGYSVIDKSKSKPPSAPRRRRSTNSRSSDREERFFTVPRKAQDDDQPMRPSRNYSTLGPSRPRRKRSSDPNLTDEQKEGTQYIEIGDDEHGKDLQSGAIIQKMKDRPLPAPPRPPRRTRESSRDSRYRDDSQDRASSLVQDVRVHETEVSIQTEPLPEGVVCEELVQERDDKIITPTVDKKKKRAVTEYDHEETITHGSLIVQPIAGDIILDDTPIEMFSRSAERIVTVRRETEPDKTSEYDETSEIPEEFIKLSSPTQPHIIERIIERQIPILLENPSEVEVMKAHKLQVQDLDVDRLAVNELHASKIKVADIESSTINVSEINSNSGNLVVGGIELPASFFQQLVEKMQQQVESIMPKTQVVEAGTQPDTPPPQPPERKDVSNESDFPVVSAAITSATDEPVAEVVQQFPTESVEESKDIVAEEQQPVIEASMVEEIAADMDILREEQPKKVEEEKKTSFDEPLEELEEIIEEIPKPPQRPPRTKSESTQAAPQEPSAADDTVAPIEIEEIIAHQEEIIQVTDVPSQETTENFANEQVIQSIMLKKQDSEETPPPRPPQPHTDIDYIPSQPPASFYALRSPPTFKDFDIDDDIPMAPRRRRHHHKAPVQSLSSSDEIPISSRRRHRTPEPTIPQLTGQLTRACVNAADRSLKRLIQHITSKVLGNADGKQDVNVVVVILIVLIACLILLGWGDRQSIHHHHWEYFNPPRDI